MIFALSYLKEEHEAHPLVIFNVSSFLWIYGFIYTRMGNIDANSFPKGTRNCVCGVNPAVRIEHIFRYVFSMNTVDGIADILSSCYY